MNTTLILFTTSYPYEGGEQFLETEIDYLSNKFEKIIIVPAKYNKNIRKIPSNVLVDNFIAKSNKNFTHRMDSLLDKKFFINLSLNLRENKSLTINMIYIKLYQIWIKKFIKVNNINKCIFYTYWFKSETTALYFTKKEFPSLKYITRVHGGDLYESLHGFNEFPIRKKIIKNINKVFVISNNGKKHLQLKYEISKDKVMVSRLGIRPHELKSSTSNDNILRIVSCSSLIPVKRVHLIIEALAQLDKVNINISWTHIGNGILESSLQEKAKLLLKNNVKYTFLGFLPNNEVYSFYRNNPVDIFVNVSSSEGIPVTIMEAQSFGIPCIATDVGGNSEIVNNENGYLLTSNPSNKEISTVFSNCYNEKMWKDKRKASFYNWKNNYNADKNYKSFVKVLSLL